MIESAKKKYAPCPAHADSKHRYNEAWTDACEHLWQYQLVCACGTKKNDGVYGTAPPRVAQELAAKKDTLAIPKAMEDAAFSLDSPADIARFIQVFFDNRFDWALSIAAVLQCPQADAYAKVEEWREDKRLKAAIDAYVRSLNDDSMQKAWLLHTTQKLATESEIGTVQATALQIQKAARITEKTEHEHHVPIQIRDLPDILSGIGAPAPKPDEIPN